MLSVCLCPLFWLLASCFCGLTCTQLSNEDKSRVRALALPESTESFIGDTSFCFRVRLYVLGAGLPPQQSKLLRHTNAAALFCATVQRRTAVVFSVTCWPQALVWVCVLPTLQVYFICKGLLTGESESCSTDVLGH